MDRKIVCIVQVCSFNRYSFKWVIRYKGCVMRWKIANHILGDYYVFCPNQFWQKIINLENGLGTYISGW